jgi:hypothetical protein
LAIEVQVSIGAVCGYILPGFVRQAAAPRRGIWISISMVAAIFLGGVEMLFSSNSTTKASIIQQPAIWKPCRHATLLAVSGRGLQAQVF